MTQLMHPDEIRSQFSSAMSNMYREEVPQYGTLIDLVHDVNNAVLEANPELKARMQASGEIDRLDIERHGAIRVGTAEELFNIRRLFAVMGMHPVGYYDLSVAGIPVHSTAFRPIDAHSLLRNPFRVFTSLIRLDLLQDQALADKAAEILAKRHIITERALALLDLAETQGGLTETQADEFVREALETFRWHSTATVDSATYQALLKAHRLIADVVSFQCPHINHLTPRTLDIDAVQHAMREWGIDPKAIIEGPARREADILLRQTSFKALSEAVLFNGEAGSHTARFGEIEQRGVALKPAGRKLYDQCLANTRARVTVAANGENASDYMAVLNEEFSVFPDGFNALREQELAYFRYRANAENVPKADDISSLIEAGYLLAEPQTYEDFLPVSAAGIFQSNLGSDEQSNFSQSANQEAFESALGARVTNELSLYQKTETDSLNAALNKLGQEHLLIAEC